MKRRISENTLRERETERIGNFLISPTGLSSKTAVVSVLRNQQALSLDSTEKAPGAPHADCFCALMLSFRKWLAACFTVTFRIPGGTEIFLCGTSSFLSKRYLRALTPG
jgi:hypothetical protein